MTQDEENSLIESVERGEWKRVQNFGELKKELEFSANFAGNAVFRRERPMAMAR